MYTIQLYELGWNDWFDYRSDDSGTQAVRFSDLSLANSTARTMSAATVCLARVVDEHENVLVSYDGGKEYTPED